MFIDFEAVRAVLLDGEVKRPQGKIAGHQAAAPFADLAIDAISKQHPGRTFRQYEFLNQLFAANPDAVGYAARVALIKPPAVRFLLDRGKDPIKRWKPEQPFEERQNDTADLLVTRDERYQIVDVKTRNSSVKSQPPNIISAIKLANLCCRMIENSDYDSFAINYLGLDWVDQGNNLKCVAVHDLDLFLAQPAKLYINWRAAAQLQFDLRLLDQTWKGSRMEWAKAYLGHFVQQATRHSEVVVERLVAPYKSYL